MLGSRSTTILLFALAAAAAGCSRKEGTLRQVRAHTRDLQGVAHAWPTAKAERQCRLCHGSGLTGGAPEGSETGIAPPSCYTCHGRLWAELDGTRSAAPADHTVINTPTGSTVGFNHHPDFLHPETACASCHGSAADASLGGDDSRPGCYLCHGPVWCGKEGSEC